MLCKLEQIFPPGFFDCMEHLMLHLPYEARVGGPVAYRWMYVFERYVLLHWLFDYAFIYSFFSKPCFPNTQDAS